MAFFEVKEVSKQFGELAAVKNLSFTLEEGEIFGIAGPNGAGKTTLFNLIAGLYPCSGSILLEGKKINNLRADQVCTSGVARTFQIPLVFSSMTVFENVEIGAHFGARAQNSAEERQIVADVLEFVGLKGKGQIEARHLPLFDKKLTMLAAALATRPRLLLLDEPIAGLSPTEIRQSVTLFERIHKELKITIIAIEHMMKVLMGISHRVMIMNNGEQICLGLPAEVAQNKEVIEVYLGAEYA